MLRAPKTKCWSSSVFRQCCSALSQLNCRGPRFQASSTRKKKKRASPAQTLQGNSPVMALCGRDVSGEGDCKMLRLHRTVVCSCQRSDTAILFGLSPRTLLCGALYGLAGQNVTIATTHHGTTFELCVLCVSHVLAYLGKGADVLLKTQTKSTEAILVKQRACSCRRFCCPTERCRHEH